VPYIGLQYVAIPEFQGLGTQVGQQMAAALAGSAKLDAALDNSQRAAERVMKQAGYIK
jgi:sorbitol/mannitol transport system substrate-binding protein